MIRQGLITSVEELKVLIREFRKEHKDIEKLLGKKFSDKHKDRMKFLVSIINYPTVFGKKTRYCSDTWEFEKLKIKRKDGISK